MLEKTPSDLELANLLGKQKYEAWAELCSRIDGLYDMQRLWNKGYKEWKYEYKYRRGGKTLCALYAKENVFGFMLVFGKDERAGFEADRQSYSAEVRTAYDEAATYHDGKWVMFLPENAALFGDFIRLLALKRRPNRKERGAARPEEKNG